MAHEDKVQVQFLVNLPLIRNKQIDRTVGECAFLPPAVAYELVERGVVKILRDVETGKVVWS